MTAARSFTLTSFGYLHGPPPQADRLEDVRKRLRDPAVDPAILDLDGSDTRVQDVVYRTPGARELVENLVAYCELPAGPSRIGIGCAGGRHRAPSLIELLALQLRMRGHTVTVQHRDIHLARIIHP